MIIKEDIIKEKQGDLENSVSEYWMEICKKAIFFDLEHYVYKVPKCLGVFGVSTYSEGNLHVKQYMIENDKDSIDILIYGKEYFQKEIEKGKKYIVTFSGNNDFTVINYLFNKNKIDFNLQESFIHIDLQREYEKEKKTSIGLKALEKEFQIDRESSLISGSTLAKTFSKIYKDRSYISRMPKEKIEKILLYNKQDVVSLYDICIKWEEYMGRNKE